MSKIVKTTATVVLAGAFILTGQGAIAATAVTSTVVSPGGQATIPISGIAAGSTSATLKITAAGAWRDSPVTGCLTTAPVAGCKESPILVAKPGPAQSVQVTVPVRGTSHALKVSNQRASVRLSVQVVAQRGAAAPVAAVPVAPVASKAPDATNTGVPAGTNLTVHNGNIVVTTPGTVIDALDIRGSVVVKAANVTIKNSIIRGRADSPNATLVNNLNHHANLVVTNSELVSANPAVRLRGIMGSNFTAHRLNIHGVEDGLHLTAGNVTLTDSFLHDNFHLVQDPNHNGTPTHDDSIQIQGGSNIRIAGNTIVGAHNAAMQITQDRSTVSNVIFTGNFANGGGCTVNVAEKARGPISGLSFTDNTFGRSTKHANCAIISPVSTVIANSGNFYTDGAAVVIRKG